jgi:queuine/archaeosine tRNA-ribosyltransferase
MRRDLPKPQEISTMKSNFMPILHEPSQRDCQCEACRTRRLYEHSLRICDHMLVIFAVMVLIMWAWLCYDWLSAALFGGGA